MATLITKSADVNINDANGFNSVETGSGAVQQTRSSSTNTTTSYVYSSAFTGTNLDVCDGLLLYCNRVNTTGTVSVALSDDNGTTATREVTVNASDLQASPGWVFFKFGSSLTLDGGTDYKVGIKGSSAGNATFFRDSTAGNWSHILRLTATVTASAGDVLYIVGEHTGAGATTTRTITMNDTASTDYGTGTAGAADNGIEIGDAGVLTFGTSAATNYTLKVSGSINIWANGTLSVGTTGTPIPRGSTATLILDCGANVDFGLIVNAAGTFNSQALSRTSGKDIVSCKLNTDEAANSTSLGVDTDTGWLDNDEIAVASTTRTASQCESGALNGAAGASSLTVDGFAGTGGGLANAHDGTSPVQAEVVLLTRSIVIRGASSSLQAYIVFSGTSTVDVDWTEMKWLGSATSGKRGIDIATPTSSNNVNIQYSSLHDFSVASSIGFNITNSNADDWTFSNNVTYNIANIHLNISSTLSGTSWVANNNIFMRNTDSSTNLVTLSDIGGVYTNNTSVGGSNAGVSLSEASGRIGTFDNITSHSNGGNGIADISGLHNSTLSNITSWRNAGSGISFGSESNVIYSIVTLFGNTTNNILMTTGGGSSDIMFISVTANGDSTFATTNGFSLAGSTGIQIGSFIYFFSCNFGTASGIKTAHTNDMNISSTFSAIRILLTNTILASTTELNGQTNMTPQAFIGSEKHDQTTGNHKTWKKYGTIAIETGTVHTGSQAFSMTPNNASNKLVSGSFYITVANGVSLTPTVYVQENGAYNGNRARLILKRNDAIGITSDTVIDTATAASDGAWEALTGTTAAATDDGVMEFVIDCDGTAGVLYVDSFSVV